MTEQQQEQPQEQPELSTALDTSPDPAPDDRVEMPAEPDHSGEAESGTDRQAAKFRKQLRAEQAARQADAEQATERITALERQLDAMRRDQVGALATTMGIKPTALWAAGAQLDDLLNDDGVPDPDKVRAAVQQARAELGLATAPKPFASLRSGTAAPAAPVNTWRQAFAPREK
ncbi:hypothetical protein A5675_15335 [Mycobacterium malmoense]|uniref:hypothetical protein n=1 Tax=Mycobacterium malmoense TaxID=1780 RepID=UPI00080B294C|nr:hypothetical protein [Mycobacterium malmoense]OCB38761.1 hypothetical protein A5675_15335 [Mycobacterium malmoense]